MIIAQIKFNTASYGYPHEAFNFDILILPEDDDELTYLKGYNVEENEYSVIIEL